MAEYNVETICAEDAEDLIVTEQSAQPDPPPNVTAGFMSTVREPTPDLVASWTTVEQVASWAKLKGDVAGTPSKAGSLVRLLTVDDDDDDDDDPSQLEIAEVASVSPKRFETLLCAWKYSREPAAGNGDSMEEIVLHIIPTPIDLGRARAFYNAARIHSKIIFSRDHSNELWLESHKAATAPRAASAPATIQLVRPPMTPDRNVDEDMVNLGATIDGRKGREILVVSTVVYNRVGMVRVRLLGRT